MSKTRVKGNRNVRRCREHYELLGYITDTVEKTSKFAISKDLFGLFDIIGLKKGHIILVQVKSNTPPTKQPYLDFAEKYSDKNLSILSYTWYDNDGAVIMEYFSENKLVKNDYRKSSNKKLKNDQCKKE